MKRPLLSVLLLAMLAPAPLALHAQSAAPEDSLNRFSASYRMAFNLGVKFKFPGGFPNQTNPGLDNQLGTENRRYDDGHNLVDNNNNTYPDYPPMTRNWGYQYGPETPGRNQVVDGRYIEMHSASSPAFASSASTFSKDVDPQPGFELTYQRRLGGGASWRWGLEGAFNYMPVHVSGNHDYTADVQTITDRYEVPADDTGFRFIPPAPYAGSDLPGPLLGSTPTRTYSVIPNGAGVAGWQDFDANLYGFRLGLYLDVPLSEKWRVALSGGLGLVQVNGDFGFGETVTVPGAGQVSNGGSGSHNEMQVGGYVAGNIFYALSQRWEVFAGAQFQSAGYYSHSINGAEVELDLRRTVFFTAGLNFSF